ncbi:MAG: hypothetical protein H3C27_02070 [Opitutaceae bacterium]|nr:hypothetical protein [Opitutaceae bacterium]
MKKSELTSLLTAATLFLAPGAIATAQPMPAPGADQPGPNRHARMLERFDANADGRLDQAERATARTAIEAEMRGRLADNPRFLQRADTDRDGALSDAEWAVAREHFQRARAERMQHTRPGPAGFQRPGAGPHRPRDPGFQRGYLLGKYDADGNRRLDEAERNQLKADRENRVRQQMEQRLARLKAVDADGDGHINDTEWAAAKATFKARRPAGPPAQPAAE